MDSQENVNLELVDSISCLCINTKFEHIIDQHLEIIQDYFINEANGVKPLATRESYHAFCASCIVISKVKDIVWSGNSSENISNPDGYKGVSIPPLRSFYYTKDEKEMLKNLAFNTIKVGDVVHLQVVEEDIDKFKLQILNKYGDNKRISDCMLYVDLMKDNSLVKQIVPPLKKSDLVRAVVFGNVKLEVGVHLNRLVSLNSKFVGDDELKDLKLGRVFKQDIPFYPEDVSEYSCLGEYLEKNVFENPKQICQRTEAFNVNQLKTGPIYDVRSLKRIHVPIGVEFPEIDYVSVHEKTKEAEDLLSSGQLREAFVKINESLSLFSDDSRALTVRGKILLAMAYAISTLNVKKATVFKKQAYLSLVDALKINGRNVEAASFHDSILRDAILLSPSMAKEIKCHVLRPNRVDPIVEEFNIKFKSGNFQQVQKETAKPSFCVTVKKE